jgi:glycosyltransferase involved in cell wall biosynthesis
MYHTVEVRKGDLMPKIALVSEDLSPPLDEGFKKASAAIADSLADIARELTVFTPEPGDLKAASATLPRNKLLLSSAFGLSLRRSAPDIILYIPQAAATAMSLLRAALLKRQSGSRTVVVMSLQQRKHRVFIRPFLRMLTGPDLVLVLSNASVAAMRRSGLRAARVPLGVDTDTFRVSRAGESENLRAKYGLGELRPILHVGHVSARRNLSALRRIAEADRQVLIVTSTSTRRDPEVAGALRHPNITVIHRFVENIDEIYRLACGYIFPTFSETGAIEIPLSILEAMASNLPVVTTPFGGIPDLFEPGGGLSICRTEDELVARAVEMPDLGTVTTRDLVLPLSWDRVARIIVETVQMEIK